MPQWLGELVHIEKLSIGGDGFNHSGYSEINSLPDSIASLSKLHSLELAHLECLASLPPCIAKLTGLERLRIVGGHVNLLSSLGTVSTKC